jgi:hypothetical protein
MFMFSLFRFYGMFSCSLLVSSRETNFVSSFIRFHDVGSPYQYHCSSCGLQQFHHSHHLNFGFASVLRSYHHSCLPFDAGGDDDDIFHTIDEDCVDSFHRYHHTLGFAAAAAAAAAVVLAVVVVVVVAAAAAAAVVLAVVVVIAAAAAAVVLAVVVVIAAVVLAVVVVIAAAAVVLAVVVVIAAAAAAAAVVLAVVVVIAAAAAAAAAVVAAADNRRYSFGVDIRRHHSHHLSFGFDSVLHSYHHSCLPFDAAAGDDIFHTSDEDFVDSFHRYHHTLGFAAAAAFAVLVVAAAAAAAADNHRHSFGIDIRYHLGHTLDFDSRLCEPANGYEGRR